MGRRTCEVALGLWILGFAGMAAADEPRQPQAGTLRMLVMNQARVRPEVLRAAQDDAAAIFAAAGVHLVWLEQASAGNEPFDVVVKIAAGMTPAMLPHNVGDLSLGFAAANATSEGRRGRLVWVFFDRVETNAGHHHIHSSRLCGLVMAHEIGHLLLPAGHSENGLMRATWKLRSGLLDYFTEPQVDAMRARLGHAQ
jgi:hypothetical protein